MKIATVFRAGAWVVLGALLMLAADHTVLAQRAGAGGGHAAAAGSGHAGAAVRPGGGYGSYGWRGGYGGRGYGWRGYGWGGRWGWGPGWGWWPLGVYVSVLPWYYSTYWWAGIPYYYADNNYYIWDNSAGAYEQVQPPTGFNPQMPSQSAPGSGELFAYPKNGQSAAKQATDTSECRAWAASQTGNGAAAGSAAQHQDYLRAEAACLEGRGYAAR